MDAERTESPNLRTMTASDVEGTREHRTFPVKQSGVSRRSLNEAMGEAASPATGGGRRSKATFEAVKAVCDEYAARNEDVSIRVLAGRTGGSFSTVIAHRRAWKEQREKASQFGGSSLSDAFKATLASAVEAEIARQCDAVAAKMRQNALHLAEENEALAEELKEVQSATMVQEEQVEAYRAATAAAQEAARETQRQSALVQQNLEGQLKSLRETCEQQRRELEGLREAAVEARIKDASHVSQIASRQKDVDKLEAALERAKDRSEAADKKAAQMHANSVEAKALADAAKSRVADKEGQLEDMRRQLQEAASRENRLLDDLARSQKIAQEEEEVSRGLRHKLDVAHSQKSSQAVNQPPGSGTGKKASSKKTEEQAVAQ